MSVRKVTGLMLGAALAIGFAAAGQAAPVSHSRTVAPSHAAEAPVVKVAAKHKATKHSKQTTQGSTH